MTSNSIPTPEDFARARALRAHRDRGLSETRAAILQQFRSERLTEFLVLYSERIGKFGAYAFFDGEEVLEQARTRGLTNEITLAVIGTLREAGREDASMDNVHIEFDTAQNVEQNYRGDYFARIG